jgi:predicted RNase H-like nuclease (RuvC/YqgF family)
VFTAEQQKAIDDMLAKQKQELELSFKTELDKANEGIEKLKQTNADLKQEKVDAIKKAEQDKIDALRAEGDEKAAVELELKRFQDESEKLRDSLQQRDDLILGKDREVAQSEVLSMLRSQDAGMKLLAKSLVETQLDGDNIKRSFKDLNGNVVADSFEGFKAWASKDQDMQHYLSGSKASGTDNSTINPSSTGHDNNDYSKMSGEERTAYLDNFQVVRN